MKIQQEQIADLIPDQANARSHDERNITAIAGSLQRFGQQKPIVVDSAGVVRAGNGTLYAAKSLGWETIATVRTDLENAEAAAYAIADNRTAELAEWDNEVLALTLDQLDGETLDATGFDEAEIAALLKDLEPPGEGAGEAAQKLADRFMLPPFSVLNAREGAWQERKRAWIGLGIKSELGRGEDLIPNGGGAKSQKKYSKTFGDAATRQRVGGKGESSGESFESGTSIFDPVLTELVYRWFSRPGALVIDPFAGGSVRGVVAAKMGREYVGHELRGEQVAANRAQWDDIGGAEEKAPAWIEGDSKRMDETCATVDADFLFSCPPYGDLEVYSDDPADISAMCYEDFLAAYREIISKACARLQPNRFACFVVGEIRDKKGAYRNFIGDTVEAFRAAGLEFYNEIILVTSVGSLPIRVGKQFTASRKVGKTHQNVLVFVKGDEKKAAAWAAPGLDTAEIDAAIEAAMDGGGDD